MKRIACFVFSLYYFSSMPFGLNNQMKYKSSTFKESCFIAGGLLVAGFAGYFLGKRTSSCQLAKLRKEKEEYSNLKNQYDTQIEKQCSELKNQYDRQIEKQCSELKNEYDRQIEKQCSEFKKKHNEMYMEKKEEYLNLEKQYDEFLNNQKTMFNYEKTSLIENNSKLMSENQNLIKEVEKNTQLEENNKLLEQAFFQLWEETKGSFDKSLSELQSNYKYIVSMLQPAQTYNKCGRVQEYTEKLGDL